MGLFRAVNQLMAAGKRVFLVEDVPFWPFDTVRRATTEAIPLRAAIEHLIEGGRIPDRVAARNADNDAAEDLVAEVAKLTGARLLNVPAAICPRGSCRYKDGDVIFYADQSHLTRAGAVRALTPLAGVIFGRAPAARD